MKNGKVILDEKHQDELVEGLIEKFNSFLYQCELDLLNQEQIKNGVREAIENHLHRKDQEDLGL